MYKHILKVSGEALAVNQVVPQNTSADGNGEALRLGGGLGGVELALVAAEDISIAGGKTLKAFLRHADEAGGAFADCGVLFQSANGGGSLTVKAGDEVGRLPVPSDLKTWGKVRLSTDDASAGGRIDVRPVYLAR